ncbi:MAG: ABC transporter permease subunit [Pleurocapsa minor GSE-CHR-MK-17-07R]|jgi:multiple sugar transport system permease protein|nr:ABC transporter permease subunit [Pleurocapsa minor GSE-CHR-MK 17-07R]
MATNTVSTRKSLQESRRRRILFENLTGFLFITPASLILLVFQIFPVGFAFFVSLHRWRRTPDEWQGLDQYATALGNFAYVAFFWLAVGVLCFGLFRLRTLIRHTAAHRVGMMVIIPAAALTAAVGALIAWFFTLLPVILDIPARLRGQAIDQEAFVREFYASFGYPEVAAAGGLLLTLVIIALLLTVLWLRLIRHRDSVQWLYMAWTSGLLLLAAGWTLALTSSEVNTVIDAAAQAGSPVPIWAQVLIIGAGTGLIGAALWLWQRTAYNQTSANRTYMVSILAVILLVVGGIFLIRELPQAFAEADPNVLRGFNVTVMYSAVSVPLQIGLGLGLAVLLFQKLKGKALFRVVFFLPYVTPFVATSVVFSLIFSHNVTSPVNQLLVTLGADTQNWLRESSGIFTLIFGDGTPAILSGPGLALIVIIIYNVWIFAGYCAVIFLAGLGGIENDLYEAARIDGANAWHQLRFITIPLLSPTTFFLILVSTIGTFQAFTQIYLMRRPGGFPAVDTVNLNIFNQIQRDSPNFGYGSALAFVLFGVILILTLIQNRVAGRRVFYG